MAGNKTLIDIALIIENAIWSRAHYVTAAGPEKAENVYYFKKWQIKNPELFPDGDYYVKVEHGYIFIQKIGAGRYLRELPVGVNQNMVIQAPMRNDQERPLLEGLRIYEQRLEDIKNFYSKAVEKDEPEDVNKGQLEFVISVQEMIRTVVRLYDLQFVDAFIESIPQQAFSSFNWKDWFRDQYHFYKITGEVYEPFLFIGYLAPQEQESMLRRSLNAIRYTKPKSWILAPQIPSPRLALFNLFYDTLHELVRNGRLHEALDAAARLVSVGEELLKIALELPQQASVMRRFNDLLFLALPHFTASLYIYNILLTDPNKSFTEAPRYSNAIETWKKNQMICDERTARIAESLHDKVWDDDLDGGMTKQRIIEISKLKAEGDSIGAELAAIQLIDQQLLYPKFFKEKLFGK